MSFTLPIAEEDLHAFVDNEVDDDKHEAVLAYLATAPADAARVEAWRQQSLLLRAAFSQVSLEPVPAHLAFNAAPRVVSMPSFVPAGVAARNACPRRLWRRNVAFSITAFIAGICIAFAGNFFVSRYNEFVASEPASVLSPQGSALALLATSALHHSAASDSIPQSVLNTPGAIAPALVILPALKRQGLQLQRGEIRGSPEHPVNCLDFADPADGPVVLCVAPDEARPAAPPLQSLAVVSTNSVYWRESASLYALAARIPNDRLIALARHIHAMLAARQKP